MTEKALEAVNRLLFGASAITDIVGTEIHYARAPVTSVYPQIIYFEVAERDTYLIDYDKATIQVSSWSDNKIEALTLHNAIRKVFRGYHGTVTTYLGDVEINWIELVDSSALPQDDVQLYGHQLRFEIRTRGQNIGGL